MLQSQQQQNKDIIPGGLLIIDKPAGLSSHDVVGRVRHLLHHRRVGHAGTLDPFATGVLLVCVGRATRMVPWLTGAQKTYEARLKFGWTSSTDDTEGELMEKDASLPDEEALRALLPSFIGAIKQRPPMHSAIRVDGERAYKKARAGDIVVMPEREVQVERIQILDMQKNGEGHVQEVSLEIVCGSGTYIRSIARDMGEALGCGAYLTALRRTMVAPYSIDQAMPFFKDKTLNDPQRTQDHLIEVGKIEIDLPVLQLDAREAERFFQGQRLAGREEPTAEQLAMRDPEGRLLGVAALREGVIHPLVVLG